MNKAKPPANQEQPPIPLEDLWDSLLSRKPDLIRQAFARLDLQDQNVVREHLERMANENGWQPEQRRSARAAIQALNVDSRQDQ